MKTFSFVFLASLVALPAAANDMPAPSPPELYLQVWLGGLSTDEDSWKIKDS
jgi:hypothetical protein